MGNIIQETRDLQGEKAYETFKKVFKNSDQVSVPLIQRKCKCGYGAATWVNTKLSDEGNLSSFADSNKNILTWN